MNRTPRYRILGALVLFGLSLPLSACSGDDPGASSADSADSGAATCQADPGECPNICSPGSGVEGETCEENAGACGCGLYCDSGVCAPYAGSAAGCSCVHLEAAGEEDTASGGADAGEAIEDGLTGPADPSRSGYTMTITMPDGTVIPIERDLTELRETTFSFGSAHIAPAVAFAVTDTITWPQSVTITLDFGKVLGSDAFPIQTSGVGEYPFSAEPPVVEVYVEFLQYKSLFDGAEGYVTLTSWGQNTDDIMAGSFAGRLIQETDNVDKLWIDVEGTFNFVLPVKHAGQPG